MFDIKKRIPSDKNTICQLLTICIHACTVLYAALYTKKKKRAVCIHEDKYFGENVPRRLKTSYEVSFYW